MFLLIVIVIIVAAFLYYSEKKQKQLQRTLDSNGQLSELWIKKEYTATYLAVALFLGAFLLWYIDTNDLELTCSHGQCFQTKLQIIHKMGFFGFAPKYFRSHVEPFAFGPEFDYQITEGTCTVNKRTRPQYTVILAGPTSPDVHIKSFCNDESGALHLKTQLHTCIKQEECYLKIESGFYEELCGGAAVLLFLWFLLLETDLEYVALDDSQGTVEIVRQSVVGFKTLQLHRMAATIADGAYVKEHVHKRKKKKWYTYTFNICIKGEVHEVLENKDKFYIQQIVEKFNQFMEAWKGKALAESNLVKLKYDCVVCFDSKVDMMFLPCAHACVCSNCSARIDRCPLCRKNIRQKRHIFLETGAT